MYSVAPCPGCNRLRIVDNNMLTSDCPYCGKNSEHRTLKKLYSDEDQTACRDAMSKLYGFVPDKKDNKERIEKADPHSTLVYRYERCKSIDEKIDVLSKGLTELYGTFTLQDLEGIDPKNAKKLLETMCDGCYVAEVRPGRYKA